MPDMTDEEYAALEEEVTRNPPKVDPAKARYPGRETIRLVSVDDLSADWLRIKAEARHTTTEVIIGEMVRERIAASG